MEPVARDLSKAYSDKGELEDALIATARRPLFMRAYANYWANTGRVQSDKYTFDGVTKSLGFTLEEIDGLPVIPVSKLCTELGIHIGILLADFI